MNFRTAVVHATRATLSRVSAVPHFAAMIVDVPLQAFDAGQKKVTGRSLFQDPYRKRNFMASIGPCERRLDEFLDPPKERTGAWWHYSRGTDPDAFKIK